VFLADSLDVPWGVVEFLAAQLEIADPLVEKSYTPRVSTVHEHARKIRAAYEYRDLDGPLTEELTLFVCARAAVSGTFTVRRMARGQCANLSDLRTLVVVAQGVDHVLQDPERARLFVLRHAAQHPDLDGSDRNGRLLEAPPTAWREPRGKNFPDRGLRRPGHVAVSFQGLQQHVHRLPCHERSSRELGVRQARALGQQLEAGVLRHGHPERPQRCLHGGAKGARGLFQQVAQ
jgi:hypothetical protein